MNITHGLFLMSVQLLTKFGIMACLRNWARLVLREPIMSYLSGRKQVVVVDGVKSYKLKVHAVVPQGSRLGPLLFIIYMNDIENDIENDFFDFC